MAIVQGHGRENRVIAVFGRHHFLGELSMLTGQRLYLSGVVSDGGEVIQVPVEKLREIVAEDKALSDIILGAFMARRSFLIDAETGIKLIGSRFSPDSRRLREFLARNRMPHQWIDLEEDDDADALLGGLAIEPDQTPVVIASGGEILRNPTNAELGRAIGLGSRGATPALCDVVVVGAGPAGLAAALYAASEGLDVQGVEAVATGGQAGTSARIENYLGFPAGVSGSELAQRAGVQALKFGARLAVPAAAVRMTSEPGRHEIELSNGETATGRTVVIATGAQYRRLDVPRLDEFEMGGVYYAATQAEAQLCAGDPVLIVGGGNSAGQAAMFLSRHASQCRLLIRGGDLGKSMSRYLVDQIERNDLVQVCLHSEVVELGGERELETRHRRRQPLRRAEHGPRQGAVRLHRRFAAHRVAGRPAGYRRRRISAHRPGRPGRGSCRAQRRCPIFPGDQSSRDLRRRRCPVRIDQARRLCGRRGVDGGPAGPRPTRRFLAGVKAGVVATTPGTALVPTDTSDASRSSRNPDASDDLDAHGHIDTLNLSAGGRKVAGSNPVAPIRAPFNEAG